MFLFVCPFLKLPHLVFQRVQVQASDHADRPGRFPPLHSHLQCYLPETRVWDPGPMEIPSRCSHCAPEVAAAPVRGVWNCAYWPSSEGRAPAQTNKVFEVAVRLPDNLAHLD